MSELESPIRVAHIMGKMVGGGVESSVMNYYRNIDKSKVQFDFIIDEDSTLIPIKEIESMGGRVIKVPPYQKVFKYIREMKKIFLNEKYLIVHSNINALSVFPLFCARLSGVPIRISHSHSTTNKKEKKKNIIKSFLKQFSRVFANNYFCCTEHAGRWLFGNRLYNSGKVIIINNAIDTNRFKYNQSLRQKMRNELDLHDSYTLGHVGRFMIQKNHEKLLNIFNEYLKIDGNSKLVLVGDGELKEKIAKKCKELGIDEKVKIIGTKNDIEKYYQAMDILIFPSLYEGLGMVLIEAQCSGLPCVSSSEVPTVAKLSKDFVFLDLNASDEFWANKIHKLRLESEKRTNLDVDLCEMGYDIKKESNKLAEVYISLASKGNKKC